MVEAAMAAARTVAAARQKEMAFGGFMLPLQLDQASADYMRKHPKNSPSRKREKKRIKRPRAEYAALWYRMLLFHKF